MCCYALVAQAPGSWLSIISYVQCEICMYIFLAASWVTHVVISAGTSLVIWTKVMRIGQTGYGHTKTWGLR